ncbi:MAG: hypothetical protein OIF50_05810 [Flavobacteriaceae bacterium]|nr:hypothetical protein [Flavobacteriaceae bacterium]
MWKRSLWYCLTLLLSFGLLGCLKDEDTNFHLKALQIESVSLPESFEVGKIYDIEVKCMLPNGCTYFNGFQVNDPELTERYIAAIGAVYGQSCTEQIEMTTERFRFLVRFDKDYTFKFWSGKDDNGEDIYIEKVVPIQKNIENP